MRNIRETLRNMVGNTVSLDVWRFRLPAHEQAKKHVSSLLFLAVDESGWKHTPPKGCVSTIRHDVSEVVSPRDITRDFEGG